MNFVVKPREIDISGFAPRWFSRFDRKENYFFADWMENQEENLKMVLDEKDGTLGIDDHCHNIHSVDLPGRCLWNELQVHAELELPWGYTALWFFMIILGISTLVYFMKRKWI